MAMKPLDGTFAENAEKWGVAGINVDGARIEGGERLHLDATAKITPSKFGAMGGSKAIGVTMQGRWPANLLLDESAAAMLDGQRGTSIAKPERIGIKGGNGGALGEFGGSTANAIGRWAGDQGGGASRFFYVAKADRAERNEGCDGLPEIAKPLMGEFKDNPGRSTPKSSPTARANHHPTVKPLDLMKYLCNLTRTPTGGIVLDPFAGSGTTLWAAEYHNRPWLGIEMNAEYVAIAEARLARERAQIKMAI